MKREVIEAGTRLLLLGIGEDLNRKSLLDTPRRVAEMYEEILQGYTQDPKDLLGVTFDEPHHREMVIVRGIPFYSLCEHHVIPFFGTVDIGYIPDGCVVGLSKLARLVDCFARRLQTQERLTTQIADAIDDHLKPEGVGVIVRAEHLCMSMRGVKKPGVNTTTSAVRGSFLEDLNVRNEFLQLTKRE